MHRAKFIQDAILLNPNLIAAGNKPVAYNGLTPLRNLVLAGNNWKYVPIGKATGVITSLNNPVKSLGNTNNTNLWYSVQGFDSVVGTVEITGGVKVIEIASPVAANANKFYNYASDTTLVAGNSTVLGALPNDIFFKYDGVWFKDKYITSGHSGALPGAAHKPASATENIYNVVGTGGTNPYTKQTWAEAVRNGQTPSSTNEAGLPAAKKYGTGDNLSAVSLAPSAGSIRLADGKANDADQLRQLASVPMHELGDRRLLEGFFGRVDKASKDGSMTAADKNPPYGGEACQPAYG
jgi:hypothetical protein